MELDFTSIDENYNNYEDIYISLIKRTFNHLNLHFEPIISVSLVDNEFIHKINKEYRNIDRPTDVISFAFLDNEDRQQLYKSKEPVVLGDIYISIDKAKEQASEYGHSLNRELSFLFVHGLLHLLGYDHMNEKDEKIMFKLQDEILPKEN